MRVLFAGPDPDLVMRTSGDDRKEGLHLSDITKRMAFEKDKKLNPNNPIDAMVLERGFTWERILELALHSRHDRPGRRPEQIQEDGIWMSPDWLNEEDEPLIEEWKCTKKSLKQGFDGISWHWMPNTMAYLRAARIRKWVRNLRVRFRIWWMNGDYSYESKNSDFHLLNEYWKVDVEFDKRELDENWRRILSAGLRYGLLPATEESWPKRKSDSKPPRRLPVKPQAPAKAAKVLTFPTTKRSPKLPDAS